MAIKSVVDLLAEQSESVLLQMRETINSELQRLRVEGQQVEQALEKQSRRGRGSSAGRTRTYAENGVARLTRKRVYALVREIGRPVTPAEARDALSARGTNVDLQNLRIHMQRLVNVDHSLVRDEDGRYRPVSGWVEVEQQGPTPSESEKAVEIEN